MTSVFAKFKNQLEDRRIFTMEFMGTKWKMRLISGIEMQMAKDHFDGHEESATMSEIATETLLRAIVAIDDEPFNFQTMSLEDQDVAREELLSWPHVVLTFLYQTYSQKEMELDAELGVAQLRNMLLNSVLTNLATLIDFPIKLSELIPAITMFETPSEITAEMLKLKNKYVEATPEQLIEETPRPSIEELAESIRNPVEEQVTEYEGQKIDPSQLKPPVKEKVVEPEINDEDVVPAPQSYETKLRTAQREVKELSTEEKMMRQVKARRQKIRHEPL